ncbi:hypothetical protein ALP42_02906 [Pseudomonas savastanoi pv. nerii]|uniref:Uncharacterized protein n=1 Tax=Pseudomonas savastanoi pv. nerii TaxID=360921 RepID=A0AB74BK41_PSESS|nr:hypothetical protein ALP42_02906 [Pseudomonas savastanoi pv. nerii]
MLLLPDEHQWTDISKIQVQAKKGIQYGLVSVAPPCECPERIAPVHAQPI